MTCKETDGYARSDAPQESAAPRNTRLERLYRQREIYERTLQKLNKQIELINQNPIIEEFLKLND